MEPRQPQQAFRHAPGPAPEDANTRLDQLAAMPARLVPPPAGWAVNTRLTGLPWPLGTPVTGIEAIGAPAPDLLLASTARFETRIGPELAGQDLLNSERLPVPAGIDVPGNPIARVVR